jgi:REP element-mobilizing transposase RayT
MLRDIAGHRRWALLAYCLMDNHIHLTVTTSQPNLDEGMRDLLSRHARRFNRTHARVGHVFGGRYYSVLINDDRQLLAVLRYVARNPVEAGVVHVASDWPWSSYSTLLGSGIPSLGFDCGGVLGLFYDAPGRARESMRRFVESDTGPEAGQRSPRRVPAISTLQQALGPRRAVVAAARLGYSHSEIAEASGLTRSGVSKVLARSRMNVAPRTARRVT